MIFAVLLGEIGKVDNIGYNSTRCLALWTGTGLRIIGGCPPSWIFQKFKILTVSTLLRAKMCHIAKFREDRSNRSKDMADFQFSI